MAMTKRVLAVLAVLMISLPVAASDVADKMIGTWTGSFRHKDIDSLLFSKSSFNMEIDGCEVSGSYKIGGADELLLTPRAIDRARQSSPTFCNTQYPEFIKDKEVNLGPVEFISNDRILVNAGRLTLVRRP
jgi:hypothetical protein